MRRKISHKIFWLYSKVYYCAWQWIIQVFEIFKEALTPLAPLVKKSSNNSKFSYIWMFYLLEVFNFYHYKIFVLYDNFTSAFSEFNAIEARPGIQGLCICFLEIGKLVCVLRACVCVVRVCSLYYNKEYIRKVMEECYSVCFVVHTQ